MDSTMILSAATLKALAHITDTQDARYGGAMSGVRVGPDRYTVTDGHLMIDVAHVESVGIASVINRDTIQRMKPSNTHTLTPECEGNATLTTSGTHALTEPIPYTGVYPATERVWESANKHPVVATIGLTPSVLLKLAKSIVALKVKTLQIDIAGPDDAIRFSGTDQHGQNVTGLMMPQRLATR